MTLMGGSVLLDSWLSIVALIAFYGEGKGTLKENSRVSGPVDRYGRVSYLEEFKEYVIQVRGDVGDLDGPPDLVGCRAETTVST